LSTLRELELQQVAPRLLEVLRRQGIASLTKFQIDAVENGIARGASQLLITHDYDEAYVIAEIALLNRVASDHRAKAIVLCPNPHQAEKRYKSLSQKCRRLGIEATALIRRRKAIGQPESDGRVIVATYQSFDIASRINPKILEGVVCVLVDRLDLIGQPELGVRLETVLVTILGRDNVQYIAILPPLENQKDLSKWLNAILVVDKKEDVKRIFSVKAFDDVHDSLADLTEFVLYKRGQVVILCANISAAEELAGQLSGVYQGPPSAILDLRLNPEHRDDLRHLSRLIMERYPQCLMTSDLGDMVAKGIAFIHEGVSASQRRIISDAWDDGLLPVIVMPIRYAIASGIRASVVFVMGVFMQNIGRELENEEAVTMLSEWQLSEVLGSAGRRGIDNEAFGIVVTDNKSERTRILAKYFNKDQEGNLIPLYGEVDSGMDETENIQDLVLLQLCGSQDSDEDPFSVINRTFWGSSSRVTDVSTIETTVPDDSLVESLLEMRSTKATKNRAKEIPDDSVKLVSVRPDKIEGLVHSGSREIWHYITLRSKDGVSCSCESWKYQGIRKHRLCKHLVKFTNFALKQEETKAYAAGVIVQALRGLEIFGELEEDGLITREGAQISCTPLGQNVAVLGVPVKDAKRVMRAISDKRVDLKSILKRLVRARKGISEGIVKQVLDRLPAEKMDELVIRDHMPGIVENCLEELEYINSILFRLMDKKNPLRKESMALEKSLHTLLDAMR
jgi:DNA-binding Lrp family transcriptional regulator